MKVKKMRRMFAIKRDQDSLLLEDRKLSRKIREIELHSSSKQLQD